MYPTLYHFFYDVFGIDIPFLTRLKTFGFLVALAFITANYFFQKEVKRRTSLGEIPIYKDKISPEEHVSIITLIAIIFGFLGAKIFAWLEDPVPIGEFLSDPFGGLTIYGGLITAFIASVVYLKKQKMPLLPFMDAVAPALMIAYAIGRLGCHFSGDGDWGIVNNSTSFLPDWLWSYTYPNNVINEGVIIPNCSYSDFCRELPQGVYPTPLYEAIVSFVLFLILWKIKDQIKTSGIIFFTYVLFNGIERFFIEKIRVNATYDIYGLHITQAEIISFLFVLIGVIGILWLKKQHSTSTT